MIYFDLAIAMLFAASFVKSRIVFSDGLGIVVVGVGLYLAAMLFDHMGLPVSAVTIFVLALVNTFLGLFLRARRLGSQ